MTDLPLTPRDHARIVSARINDCISHLIASRDLAHQYGMMGTEMGLHGVLGKLQMEIDLLCAAAGIEGPLWPDEHTTAVQAVDEEADTQPSMEVVK